MRLDPKYFNLFIFVCAAITVVVILYGTIKYHQNQEETFRDNIEHKNLEELWFQKVAGADSLRLSEFRGRPMIIDFWSTWSGKSQHMHTHLNRLVEEYPDLIILSAAVRDSEDLVKDYIRNQDYPFIYIWGTDFYHELQVPGIPSQIFIDREGHFHNLQVGEDPDELNRKIRELVSHE